MKDRWFSPIAFLFLSLVISSVIAADGIYQPKPEDPFFNKFNPRLAPEPGRLLLQPNDRLVIIGDSITEQKMYSRIIETYLTVCTPQLHITTRQLGWSGETAEGFLKRMDSDCLRFKPTVATLCYGMNDSRYRPYDDANGQWYREQSGAIVRNLKVAGMRVVLGSPGCAGKLASWVKVKQGTLDEHNLNLCTLRDIALCIAKEQEVRFADVFWPMFVAQYEAANRYTKDFNNPYAVAGKDGIHPGWAGHTIMAYAFLRAMGLDGNIGTFTVDWASGTAEATEGHTVDQFANGQLTITSTRYPFCAEGPMDRDDSIRSGMTLVPFNKELNRLMLVVKNAPASGCTVSWGQASKTYTTEQLAAGVNLADDFVSNPFCEAFKQVDKAVAAKQEYETKQIKEIFHGDEGKADIEAAVKRTEAERAPLAAAIIDAIKPVTHTLKITPAETTVK